MPSHRRLTRRRPMPEQKMTHEQTGARPLVLSTVPSEQGENKLPLAAVGLSLLIFVALVPFARMQLPQLSAFMPVYQSALTINDLITAILLYAQVSTFRARALLVLAEGVPVPDDHRDEVVRPQSLGGLHARRC